MKVVAFSGPSNSGKTTLIENIVKKLNSSYKISVVKSDPSDKARFDIEGKDSDKFFKAGADVIIASPFRTTYFSHTRSNLNDFISLSKGSDFLFIEGKRYLKVPRIVVFREEVEEEYFKYADLFVVSNKINTLLPKERIDINDIDEIIYWILNNGKEIS